MTTLWVPHEPDTWPWRIGTLRRDTVFRTWHGHGAEPEFTERIVPAGTRVRIVMASSFGDVGITTDLSAETGHRARVALVDLEPVPGQKPPPVLSYRRATAERKLAERLARLKP